MTEVSSTISESFKNQLKRVLENENFRDCTINLYKDDDPLGGFLAESFLAEVDGKDKDNERKTLQVFIKCGKDPKVFRGAFDSVQAYRRELYFYGTVFIEMSKLISEASVSLNMEYIPKCFASLYIDNIPVIILENLKVQGYRLYDCAYPIDINHMRLIYENYAKLHATSFVLRDKKPEIFKELAKNLYSIGEEFWRHERYDSKFKEQTEIFSKMLSDAGHTELVHRWKKYIERGSLNILREADQFRPEETAVVHADGWNNNFLFSYQVDDTTPKYEKIVDFQMCQLQSPVMDLSVSFYYLCDTKLAAHFDELIEYYYKHLSTYMRLFGCDPEKLFPLSTLKSHWRQYSVYPALKTWHSLHCVLCEKDDIEAFEDLDDSSQFIFKKEYKIKDPPLFLDRLVAIIGNYCDYQEKYKAF